MSSNLETINPDVSVVMSVYNGADTLAPTVESVLLQEGVDFEFVIVNDGSTDETGALLNAYAARDGRMRVLHQPNRGLTRALIGGCEIARGRFIARHDAGGDISLAGRLVLQRDYLDSHPSVALVSCGTQFLGPDGEVLYEVSQKGQELQRGLLNVSVSTIKGPSHHASVMMRREAYDAAGGYRAAFCVAQDIDLWLRMAELGICHATPDVLYLARVSLGSISTTRREEQIRTAETILACARARRAGQSDADIVAKWEEEASGCTALPGRISEGRGDASFYRFLGGVLRRRNPIKAAGYYAKAAGYYAKAACQHLPHRLEAFLSRFGEDR